MIEETISHYRLLSKLGAGGMGEVYLAKDVHLDRDVAIKFPSSLSLDETDRARFLREARLASAFHHPNIATIFDFGETADHRPFLVMELVRGRSLQDLIAHHELNLSQSIDICLDVSRALTEAHSHGISCFATVSALTPGVRRTARQLLAAAKDHRSRRDILADCL